MMEPKDRNKTLKLSLQLLTICLIAVVLPSVTSRTITTTRSPSIPSSNYGPIVTNGKRYSKVCDEARFADLKLNMSSFGYCDKSKSYEWRVKDLIGLMTLNEKVMQLGDIANGTDRIGLPSYGWWSEALHGVSDAGHATHFGELVKGATSFPNVIVMAATFNESLWNSVAQVTSTEARAMYNVGYAGLTFWSPNVNVARDPRWGRILETPGEDPFLAGRYAVQFVRGMQDVKGHEHTADPNSRPLKVSACCKHFAAYDLENWQTEARRTFDARVTEQDMVETFLRPFEMCVTEGDVSSVMCSFNRVNGFPVCADVRLMSQLFRNKYNLHGYIVSDCDALTVIDKDINWLDSTSIDTVARVMDAGLDLSCQYGPYNYYKHFLSQAVHVRKVREGKIDNALKNLYMVLMRTGFFDGMPEYEKLGVNNICSHDHTDLASDAARQGIVLLKNDQTLPLDPHKYKNIALVGPHANSTTALIGNYAGKPCKYVSPLQAISRDVSVNYQRGCADVLCVDQDFISPAAKAARAESATIIVVGLDLSVEAEERDRTDLLLPGHQSELVKQVAEASAGPVVLVIISGGCVDVSFAQNNPKIGAIVWAGYPGAQGGEAIADIVFGRHNPGGKLPITWYKNDYVRALPMTSMQLRPVPKLGYPGRTYKFFDSDVLYPFGHGLSYTKYRYSILNSNRSSDISFKVDPQYSCKHLRYIQYVIAPSCPSVAVEDAPCTWSINFDVVVTNTGEVDGEHAVLVYSKPPLGIENAPIKQLVAFKRVAVKAKGGSERVSFSLNACDALGLVGGTGYKVLPVGSHTIVVGDDSEATSFNVDVDIRRS